MIAVSEAMRRDVLSCYTGIDPHRVHIIHNGIDASRYRPDRSGAALARHGIDPARPLVVFVGRITRQKGLPHLLRAAVAIDPAAQLVCIASSPDTPEIAVEVRELRDAARAQGASIVWIEEMVRAPRVDPGAEPRRQSSSARRCTSHSASWNLEAHGLRGGGACASDVGGIPRSWSKGRPAFWSPATRRRWPPTRRPRPGFEATLAERVNRLIDDPALSTRLGAAGRQRVLDHFTWERVAERTLEVYREVLAVPSAAAG